ncbi:hypothetical protein [Streptomyces sp. SPB162]|uniref:hypothetical protein n=1 Tax=Streptomyces sp. SPB162 TaxID=2940560 RepID=UPI00240582F6|nr:hypothetical protein [Streptomyces sp. SPB162]MDF9813700.1 hypothetical protein [Streptomyces sp. SPB162]
MPAPADPEPDSDPGPSPTAAAPAPAHALPDSYALPRRPVPSFPPIRAGRGRGRIRLWTAPHRGRRLVAAGLAMTAAVLATTVPHRQLPWW